MKLISYRREGQARFGAVTGQGVVELSGQLDGVEDLATLLGDPAALEAARRIVASTPVMCPLTGVQLEPVIPRPGKVVCVGINYVEHAHEAGRKIGEHPVIFQRYHETLIAHGAPLLRPKVSGHFDFEAELAVVIGKGGAHIDAADAMSHVAGYTCFNDASVRDWQFHTHQYGMGKNFQSTGALGPWLVTADEIADYRELLVTGTLNGEQMQHGRLAELAFDIPALIAYISKALPWHPGDILATGTPSGIGFKRTPPVFLAAGDTFEVTISQIGTLSNPVIDEA
ncbi:FAA hydrolase family protein [Duganella sp. BJB488]|uniref:fumarylacetoacetate hydrolase family protein n=1 Tax=unclassified Duganella TaxID=2636909 RepID=UPI000E34E3CC|nr:MULTISPECIES: fumarylacetoacetate hydrolase family protein [unclassified Duganella]RFP09290.1 FAA hydrolase family protein [Duganella sp. BJB475]RFP13179.1 FAA hydrolase family protein [Duganella sp. BJB489]RFP17061.1 FAA hydrolase family protein [Duganella sp. BJB488]RFP25325.1 FAA hydrolase family protein [Duganella sp. BJB476]RFP31533.1 FAA hydrolase family protein [Duganella sp. BJB480]